jgi:hypothetical protein
MIAKRLDRRTFLRGSGIAMGLPLLENMLPSSSAHACDLFSLGDSHALVVSSESWSRLRSHPLSETTPRLAREVYGDVRVDASRCGRGAFGGEKFFDRSGAPGAAQFSKFHLSGSIRCGENGASDKGAFVVPLGQSYGFVLHEIRGADSFRDETLSPFCKALLGGK